MKKWYLSKTLWINIVAVVALIAQLHFGFIIVPETRQESGKVLGSGTRFDDRCLDEPARFERCNDSFGVLGSQIRLPDRLENGIHIDGLGYRPAASPAPTGNSAVFPFVHSQYGGIAVGLPRGAAWKVPSGFRVVELAVEGFPSTV